MMSSVEMDVEQYSDNERKCPVLKVIVSEMDCYETIMGCMDTIIHYRSGLTSKQIADICRTCKYYIV